MSVNNIQHITSAAVAQLKKTTIVQLTMNNE